MSAPTGGFDPSLFQDLALAEDRHFWFRARNRLIFELTRNLSRKFNPGYFVLEVGCGTGNVLKTLRKACIGGTVVGLELWFEGLRFAKQRSEGPLVQGDIRHYPFRKQFELIGMFDVLEHIPEEAETLLALREALAPNGRLILTVPAHQYLWSYFDEGSHHCRRYSEAEIRSRLEAAGFQVEFLSQFMASTLPLVWLWRKMGNLRRGPSSDAKTMSAGEFRIVPVVNGVLAALLKIEALWVSRRHTLPIGSSLIVIARQS